MPAESQATAVGDRGAHLSGAERADLVRTLTDGLRAALGGDPGAHLSGPERADLVRTLADGMRATLGELDPASLPGAECAGLTRALAATEKACAAARLRLAARASAAGAHRTEGFRDPADWLASVSGTSAGEAKAALGTAAALDACPLTRDALSAGELSMAQAREITSAAAGRPGSEAELVALAKRASLGALRDEARKRRFAAIGADALHASQQAARAVRHWRDDLGMVCGRFALPPEIGVPFVNRLDAETDRRRRRARKAGSCEEREAHAADAFAVLVAAAGAGAGAGAGADEGVPGTVEPPGGSSGVTGRRGGGSADLVIVCDLRAWRRGAAHGGEPCHVVGGTPVPVSVARELAADGDPFVKAVLHDGRRIDTVVHWGRHIPAEVRTALELGPPPDFDGAVCVEPGCGRRHGLEWDHVNPVANRGPTSYANLAARCWPHHHDKTDRDRAAGLLGPSPRGGPPGRDPP